MVFYVYIVSYVQIYDNIKLFESFFGIFHDAFYSRA